MKIVHLVWFFCASILLVVVSFLVGNLASYYPLSTSIPSPTPTKSPDLHQISTVLFSIRLPHSWEVIESSDASVTATSSDYISKRKGNYSPDSIQKGSMVTVKTKAGPLKPDEVLPDEEVAVRWRTLVNGEDAIVSVEKLSHNTSKKILVQFDRDTTAYSLELIVHNSSEDKVESMLYSLLSSFQFR